MIDKNILALVCLHSIGFTHNDLKTYFSENKNSHREIWEEVQKSTFRIPLGEKREQKIREKIKNIQESAIEKILDEKSIEIITFFDDRYPESLKSINHAPFFLYVRGQFNPRIPLLGVVGSRKYTHYGKKILEKILPEIIRTGMGIVSGGATGIDSISHHISLQEDGYTIAVFGTGIDRCYPAENKKLFEDIIACKGAVISHFPLGTGPEMYNFPIRNEIVAALSRGILIPEAGLSSGTLITAQLALEHGRDVFAVPGDIDRETSEGTNMLISSGQGKCVRCAGDVLEEYFDLKSIGEGMTPLIKAPPEFTNDREKLIYTCIQSGYTSIDELLRETLLDMTDLLTDIALLEIEGHISLDQMGRYHIQ